MLPTIPLKKNMYTDGGFRLRRNYFYRADQWISDSVHSKNVFYDYMWYNTDNF
jgi:hypothetical protein